MNHRRVLTTLSLLALLPLASQAQIDLTLFPGVKAAADSIEKAEAKVPVITSRTAVDTTRNACPQEESDTVKYANAPAPADISTNLTVFSVGLGAPVDTIDIGDERIRVVLKDDHSWYYIKNMDLVAEDPVFSEDWEVNVINPFKETPIDSLPYRMTVCLVDSVSKFVCPHQGKVFSKFGIRHGRNHTGCDIPYPVGTPVHAAFDGRVRTSMYYKGYGNIVILRHENGLETFYGHMSKRNVEPGQWVHAGDVIGLGGSTGRSTGPHLHFETRLAGHAFDPERIVDFETGKLRRNVLVIKRSQLSTHSRYIPSKIEEEEEIYMTDEQIKAEEERIAAERNAMKYHTIKQGDTLGGIARKYGTSVSRICSLNSGLTPNTILRLGRKIRVK